ncbi:hypothetical protein VTI28DRAFT_7956 [Corynascus sepedonium]
MAPAQPQTNRIPTSFYLPPEAELRRDRYLLQATRRLRAGQVAEAVVAAAPAVLRPPDTLPSCPLTGTRATVRPTSDPVQGALDGLLYPRGGTAGQQFVVLADFHRLALANIDGSWPAG